MSIAIAITGNCHAQYYAAALTHMGNSEVRCVGRPFAGPIMFKGTVPKFISPAEYMDWLKNSQAEKKILLRQVTPLGRYAKQPSSKNALQGIELVDFPYIKFDTFQHRENDGSDIRIFVRGDKIFNELSLNKAGIDGSYYTDLQETISENPCIYTRNHFSGKLFLKILEATDLFSKMPAEQAKSLKRSMETDVGIAHDNSGRPSEEAISALKLSWLEERYQIELSKLKALPFEDFLGEGIPATADKEYYIYQYWRTLFHEHKVTGKLEPFLKCLRLYRSDNRFYKAWFINMASMFVDKNKIVRASIMAADRLSGPDPRGLFLDWCLNNRTEFLKSPSAKKIFFKRAANHPRSGAEAFSQVLRALDK